MDHQLYRKYRLQYLKTAFQGSDRSPRAIYTALTEIPPPGRFSFHQVEKIRALRDLRDAFESHRHWPLEIVLSQLGIALNELETV
jgi:hypothetical protein